MGNKYKKTELGEIPKDWEMNCLNDLANKIGDGIHATPKYDDNGSYFFVNGNNLINGRIIISADTKKVSSEEAQLHYKDLNSSTILLSINGTIGNIAYYQDEKIILGKSAAYLNLNKKILKEYFFQLLQSSFIKRYFENELTGSTIKNLGLGSIRNTKIPLPPKAEQEKIAAALSNADELINQLEKLRSKKQNIKFGAMQKLLKPKTNWETKRLGEVCGKITTGKLDANKMNPDGEYRFYTCAKDFYYIDKYAFDDEALLISGNGENVGYVHYYKGKFNAYQRTYVLTDFSINIQFIKKYLDKFLASRIEVEVNTGNTPYIRMGTLTEMDIYFPKSLSEQTRIAQILSDMDAEIEQLEEKIEKYKNIKQGMMQELLTGRVRLLEED